ncbi:lytic polysaccharide monooxygenase [Piedraia hortae CBS 480.64]|uniref:Lytic polysaccharide monooxygenase n=1 Tax=Piedraia hortae CBS 480.64 TaxID=1314780 RepID=A0A6A7BTY4_9PEZI|nr:lytic polysaccharide monooxygenase [Piedraia hortae CBS 480.64]
MYAAALIIIGLSLMHTANAHFCMLTPSPIPESAQKPPLQISGSDFPCHGANIPTSGGATMEAGSTQHLSWDLEGGNSYIIHGGGSCQVSITYETEPAKLKDPKNWFVIYSIEGGCPTNSVENYLNGTYKGPQGDYTGSVLCTDPRSNGVDCINEFDFTIPKGVKSGHAILSWTWFPSLGMGRDMYQNCVNVDLVGGDGSEMGKFPTLFVANVHQIGGEQCPTTKSYDLQFPFPGAYTTTKRPPESATGATVLPFATPEGASCSMNGAPRGDLAAQAYDQPTSTASPQASPADQDQNAPTDITTLPPSLSKSAASVASKQTTQPVCLTNGKPGNCITYAISTLATTAKASPTPTKAGAPTPQHQQPQPAPTQKMCNILVCGYRSTLRMILGIRDCEWQRRACPKWL